VGVLIRENEPCTVKLEANPPETLIPLYPCILPDQSSPWIKTVYPIWKKGKLVVSMLGGTVLWGAGG
jgi:hypothetical protein